MMAAMRHPNVVLYLGVCSDPPCVVTEYCARGSLNDVFKRALLNPLYAAHLDWCKRCAPKPTLPYGPPGAGLAVRAPPRLWSSADAAGARADTCLTTRDRGRCRLGRRSVLPPRARELRSRREAGAASAPAAAAAASAEPGRGRRRPRARLSLTGGAAGAQAVDGAGRGQGHELPAHVGPAGHPPRPQVAQPAGRQALAREGARPRCSSCWTIRCPRASLRGPPVWRRWRRLSRLVIECRRAVRRSPPAWLQPRGGGSGRAARRARRARQAGRQGKPAGAEPGPGARAAARSATSTCRA